MRSIWSGAALLAVGLSGCGALGGLTGGGASASAAMPARADLVNAQGLRVGNVTLTPTADGQTRVQVRVTAMPPGEHGFHMHEVGRCDAPDFASAGAHLNPTSRRHGTRNPDGPHAGDLPNLVVRSDGSGEADFTTDRVTTRGTASNSVFRSSGVSVLVHASRDDYQTDPSGNSGARIACGVITR